MKRRHVLGSREERPMAYRIAGIDVHKKMLAVAVANVEVDGEWQFDDGKSAPADAGKTFLMPNAW
jgi:hypothetical protein